jgi:hypothetical protein
VDADLGKGEGLSTVAALELTARFWAMPALEWHGFLVFLILTNL